MYCDSAKGLNQVQSINASAALCSQAGHDSSGDSQLQDQRLCSAVSQHVQSMSEPCMLPDQLQLLGFAGSLCAGTDAAYGTLHTPCLGGSAQVRILEPPGVAALRDVKVGQHVQ